MMSTINCTPIKQQVESTGILTPARSLPRLNQQQTPDYRHVSFSTPNLLQKAEKRRSNMAKDILLGKKQGCGTPSYPSPLDRIRDGRSKVSRAEQLGLVVENEASFELNQSFPKVAKSKMKEVLDVTTPNLDQFECEGLNDVSFSPGFSKGSFSIAETSLDLSLNESWSFYNYVGGGETGHVFPQAVRNPNKAICTINAKTSEILVANEMACDLFGYDKSQLIGRNLKDMIQLKSLDQMFLSESHLQLNGDIVDISGKVFDVTDSDGISIPVSLWVKKLDNQHDSIEEVKPLLKCLVVMEPVKRTVATVTFTKQGRIVSCDHQMALMYGCSNISDVIGLELNQMIPAIRYPVDDTIPKDVRSQTATGRTKHGATFPLSLQICSTKEMSDIEPVVQDDDVEEESLYYGIIWVFANISGMICFLPNGKIHSVNESMARLLFGFQKQDLIGKDISILIPDLLDVIDDDDNEDDGIALPPIDDEIILIPKPIPKESKDNSTCTPDISSIPVAISQINQLHLDTALVKTSTPNKSDTSVASTEESPKSTKDDCLIVEHIDDDSIKNITINDSIDQSNNNNSVEIVSDGHISISSQDTSKSKVVSIHEINSSGNGSSLTESSVSAEESSDDGVNADVSGDIESSFGLKEGSNSSLKQKNAKNWTGLNMARKKMLEKLDTSSSSTDNSQQFLDSKLTSFLPLLSKQRNNSQLFYNSDTQIDDESSYFSHDSQDTYSSPSSLEHSTDHSPSSMNNQNKCNKAKHKRSLNILEQHQSFSFSGTGQHADGWNIGIMFQVKKVELGDGSHIFCMWISRDPEEPGEGGRSYASLTLASSFNSTLDQSLAGLSLGEVLCNKANSESKIEDTTEDEKKIIDSKSPEFGQYSQNYDTLMSIGKGAFGFVKLAQRQTDDLQVVVKFIQKKKVNKESWVVDESDGRIPLEVSLLRKLHHPNIIQIIDVYQNDVFIQMVMEKHGSGMDLFEFIDRCPQMDEALVSYMFRQMVSGVSYLHSCNILHRDIKDENIILDEKFNIKLIDFGAAAYMKEGKLFGTFCGTLEYCSPEVISGNKYRGPELEIWSMGVTLYTLVFGENPFYDVDETLAGILNPPCQQSKGLMYLISWMLHVDPKSRATIQDLEENAWVNQDIDINSYSWQEVLPNCEFTGNTACDNRGDVSDDSQLNNTDHTASTSLCLDQLSINDDQYF
ncbi:PAS domain-containing serine/threonine-protein kinase [Patella vulgata]|uniref:PAS domain-containing serine/threonine-protein kinase n=1 Tax=Patella vulgata TaxID=6465 RepID=UPI00217FFF88|nr:PAS domain-containing serine/threonine-protein kinase [Patella vulgata]